MEYYLAMKRRETGTHYGTAELRKHTLSEKKSGTKDHVLPDSVRVKHSPIRQLCDDIKQLGGPWGPQGRVQEWQLKLGLLSMTLKLSRRRCCCGCNTNLDLY